MNDALILARNGCGFLRIGIVQLPAQECDGRCLALAAGSYPPPAGGMRISFQLNIAWRWPIIPIAAINKLTKNRAGTRK